MDIESELCWEHLQCWSARWRQTQIVVDTLSFSYQDNMLESFLLSGENAITRFTFSPRRDLGFDSDMKWTQEWALSMTVLAARRDSDCERAVRSIQFTQIQTTLSSIRFIKLSIFLGIWTASKVMQGYRITDACFLTEGQRWSCTFHPWKLILCADDVSCKRSQFVPSLYRSNVRHHPTYAFLSTTILLLTCVQQMNTWLARRFRLWT